MSARASVPRRIAFALMAHAGRMLPSARSAWAEAMKNELHHIEGDGRALTWAAGCVLASYVERGKVVNVLHAWYGRGLLTLLIVGQAVT